MGEIAGWIAPVATAIAAIMTASNLGTRVTGWGFVVFAVGSLAWVVVAAATGQTNLLLTNAFLLLVNVVGIWRWLGRQANYDKGARVAEESSEQTKGPELFQLSLLQGKPVLDPDGETAGHVVDGMAECRSGRISYLVIRQGSEATMAEHLHALPWDDLRLAEEELYLCGHDTLAELPEMDSSHWPARIEGN